MSTNLFICTESQRPRLLPTTIPEEASVLYLHQSRQILNLKKRSIMTAHQQYSRGTQMLASTISSKVSQWTWYQLATWSMTKKIHLN